MKLDLKDLLKACIDRVASDLHLTENSQPILRIHGKLIRTEFPILTKDDLKKLMFMLTVSMI